MCNSESHPESGAWKLPNSSWVVPAMTIVGVLVALATALLGALAT